MIRTQWLEMAKRFENISLDKCVVMPNHFHGVIFIIDDECDKPVGAPLVGAQNGTDVRQRAGTSPAPTLGEIVGAFKSITTNEYIRGVKQHDWPSFPGKLWQRNYGACPERSRRERVIRDQDELNRIREYIIYNPVKWADDSPREIFLHLLQQHILNRKPISRGKDNPKNW